MACYAPPCEGVTHLDNHRQALHEGMLMKHRSAVDGMLERSGLVERLSRGAVRTKLAVVNYPMKIPSVACTGAKFPSDKDFSVADPTDNESIISAN